MPTLTMTPCYSIMLSFLALILIIIIAAPVLIIILRRAWEVVESKVVKTKKKEP